MNLFQAKTFFNTKPVEFIFKNDFSSLNEDLEFIPKFKLKNLKELNGIEVNSPMKFSEDILIKGINYGMVFLVLYKGIKDNLYTGRERILLPLVLGKSSKGKLLIRAYHLEGWSVSKNRYIKKIWRMFRADRIFSLSFVGSFYRMPPQGYNMNDRGMRGGILAKADFSVIRKNQQSLVNQNVLQNREEISLGDEKVGFSTIRVKPTDTKLDLNKLTDNPYINNIQKVENYRMTFLKSIYGNNYIAVLNSLGQPGNTVKVITDKNKNIGTYKVLDSTTSQVLKNIKRVKGNTIFDLYIFEKKL